MINGDGDEPGIWACTNAFKSSGYCGTREIWKENSEPSLVSLSIGSTRATVQYCGGMWRTSNVSPGCNQYHCQAEERSIHAACSILALTSWRK